MVFLSKAWGYIGITLSVRPCILQAQLLLNGLLEFYETLHICSTLPVDVHEGIKLILYLSLIGNLDHANLYNT
jgi:hypothetical protein